MEFNANEQAERYKEWLNENTKVSVLTIQNYFYVIRRLLNSIDKVTPTIKEVNRFINEYERNDNFNVLTVRASIKHYYAFIGIPEIFSEVKVVRFSFARKRPPSDITLNDIILLEGFFVDPVCKDVFVIQSQTGCRSMEAWLINSENVVFKDGFVSVHVYQKGGGTNQIIIPNVDIAKSIFGSKRYVGKKYPFLPNECQTMNRQEIISHYYPAIRVRYNRAWHKACKTAKLKRYASHDARRAIGRAVTKNNGIYEAKRVLRHKRITTTELYNDGSEVDIAGLLRSVRG